jgi:hypothetical protein
VFPDTAEALAIFGALLHQYVRTSLHTVIADVTAKAFNQFWNFAVVASAKRATPTPSPAQQTLKYRATGDKHCGNGEQR